VVRIWVSETGTPSREDFCTTLQTGSETSFLELRRAENVAQGREATGECGSGRRRRSINMTDSLRQLCTLGT
jgi:hypothetical protein